MIITAKDFVKSWKDFTNNEIINDDWQSYWSSNTTWSGYILGGKRSSNEDSPIGKYFQQIYGEEKLGFRSEDGSVDLSFYDKSSTFGFNGLDKNWVSYPFTRADYPSHYLALIEHENDLYTAWQEMAKLTYYRSRLKVLITYHSLDDLSEEKRALEIEMLVESFKSVLFSSNARFPEHDSTEYLIIVGGRVNNEILWTYSVFNPNGEKKAL